MLTEEKGCEVLGRCFRAAGLQIEESFRFEEDGVSISLDGWDPARRIGFEFVTTEAGDRAELTPRVVASLERRMRAGELAVLIIDELDIMTEEALARAAEGFLTIARARRWTGGGRGGAAAPSG